MRTRRPITVLVFVVVLMTACLSAAPVVADAPATRSPALPRFSASLPIPAVVDATAGGTVSLDAVNGTNRFHSKLPLTPTFGYVAAGTTPPTGATYLGPTIEVRRGHPVVLRVANKLHAHPLAAYVDTSIEGVSALDRSAPRIATHLHGGHTPPASDGGPVDTFRRAGVSADDFAGGTGTFEYSYPNDQEATQLWYHDHALGITRLNVEAGLAGNYFVRDAYDTGRAGNPLGLPYGTNEMPLVLQDRSFNADGTFAYPIGPFVGDTRPDYPNQWAPESFGDVATVNGKAWPNLDVNRGIYRFRVLNGSNARFYRLALRGPNGAPVRASMSQIGSEGGLLDTPVTLNSLLLAPGQRADVLVDFGNVPRGQKILLTNDAVAPFPGGDKNRGLGGTPLPQIMQFTETGAAAPAGEPTRVPARLRGGAGLPAALPALTATHTRTVLLNEILDPATGDPTEVLLNNLGFHEHVNGTVIIPRTTSIESPKLNTVEEWVIANTTADAHPIHIHLTQFRILNRQAFDANGFLADFNPGLPAPAASDKGPWPIPSADPYLIGAPTGPDARESGWTDTVIAYPGTVTRILVPFGGTAAGIPAAFAGDPINATTQRFVGTYVWHCHILEHEDNDMMQPYRIIP